MRSHEYVVRVSTDAEVRVRVLAQSDDEAFEKASEIASDVFESGSSAFRVYGSAYFDGYSVDGFELRTDRAYTVDIDSKERLCAEA